MIRPKIVAKINFAEMNDTPKFYGIKYNTNTKFQPDVSLYLEAAWAERKKPKNFFLKIFINLCFSFGPCSFHKE
jgi:hypothetical protein